MKIKKGDTVQIIKGKDKGKTGKIMRVFPYDLKVLVENINQYKRHLKSRSKDQPSEIVTITKPVHVSNVALIDSTTKKRTRVGYSIVNDKKVRISKRSGQEI